jgi:DNA-binding MurR/RpiR family transcriptional regulator
MSQASIETEIHQAMSRLTSAEARAARALLNDYPTLGLAPVAEFAAQSHTSAATVLRFVSQIGCASYPDFQKRLRNELSERIKSPLDRPHRGVKSQEGSFLASFAERLQANLDETIAQLPQADFESACAAIASARAVHTIGGRFTDSIAAYVGAHLRVLRPGVRHLDSRPASRGDQLLDVGGRDAVLIFDMRRYDEDLFRFAGAAKSRGAKVLLITDTWISPVSRFARHVLACKVDVGATWDSNAALFAVAEALVARVSELLWESAEERIEAKEAILRSMT